MARRNRNGGSLAEFGPALFIFLIVLLFPLLDFLSMSLIYTGSWYLNYACANAVARAKQAEGNQTLSDATAPFVNSSIGSFLGLKQGDIQQQLTYTQAQKAQPASSSSQATTAMPAQVTLSTSVTARPFLAIPLFARIPGLNSPVTFTFSTQLAREETE